MRPLAVVILTAAFGGIIGLVGIWELRRRRRRPRNARDTTDLVTNGPGETATAITTTARNVQIRNTIWAPRMRGDLSLLRILFEFLLFVISVLLAWVVSPGDQSFLVLLHMVMIWVSLRSVGVSLPSESDLDDDGAHPTCITPPPSSDIPDIDGDSTSRDPIVFLGRPPPVSSSSYHWVGPIDGTFKIDICSVVHNYWTFFGSEHMSKLKSDLTDSKVLRSGKHLISRGVVLQLNPPYFIASALGGISKVDICERSVWDPEALTFRVYSSNISSRNYVTIMDICEMHRDQSNPDWTCMTRRVCFQVSNSVGLLRSSLESLIRSMIHKKAQEFVVKFEKHLESGQQCTDRNRVLASVGHPSS